MKGGLQIHSNSLGLKTLSDLFICAVLKDSHLYYSTQKLKKGQVFFIPGKLWKFSEFHSSLLKGGKPDLQMQTNAKHTIFFFYVHIKQFEID